MPVLSRRNPQARRAAIIDATGRLIAERGLAATSIDRIVRAAGVAKGTFYLYFKTKDDVVNAMVERMVDRLINRVEAAVDSGGLPPAERLSALADALIDLAGEPGLEEVSAGFHRPENRAAHDRMAEKMSVRLLALFERIIADGIADGSFRVDNPHLSARWVIGALMALDSLEKKFEDLKVASSHLNRFVLRGLGYTEVEGR